MSRTQCVHIIMHPRNAYAIQMGDGVSTPPQDPTLAHSPRLTNRIVNNMYNVLALHKFCVQDIEDYTCPGSWSWSF
jgi:hypothetical protein